MPTHTLALPTHAKVILSGSLAAAIIAAAFVALSVFAQEGPEIITSIHTTAHATTTEAAIGTSVHAEARVATTTGTTSPTGTVDFNLYEGTSCTGTPTTHAGVILTDGVAESATTTVPAAGLSYRVVYNGDADNMPSEGACVALTALGLNASITTLLSTTTALVGAEVYDTATLHNVTLSASGTVAYTVYTNSACSAGTQSAGTKNVSNTTVPVSETLEFDTPGTYYWQAVYSGDSQNAAATSTCTSEVLTILATSTPPDADDDKDDDKDDRGKHKGFVCGLPFGIIKKVFNDLPVPFGIFKRFGSSWDEDCVREDFKHSDKSKHDDEENEDEDEDDDDHDNRGEWVREQMKEIKNNFNRGRHKNDD